MYIQWNTIQPLKRKEILTHAPTRMNLEHLLLTDKPITKGQLLWDTNYMRLLRVKFIETESRVVANSLGVGVNENLVFNGAASDWGDEKVLESYFTTM